MDRLAQAHETMAQNLAHNGALEGGTMTADEILLVILAAPFAGWLGGWLGRKWQRHVWMLDRPYAERVEHFCKDR